MYGVEVVLYGVLNLVLECGSYRITTLNYESNRVGPAIFSFSATPTVKWIQLIRDYEI